MMLRLARGPYGQSGFGMVSLLIAIVLLAIGVIALSASSTYLTSLHTDAAERSRATALAISYMEEVKTRDPAGLASEGPVTVDEVGAPTPDGAFVRRMSVTPEPTVLDAVRVAVHVDYPAGWGRTRTVELLTVIYRGSF